MGTAHDEAGVEGYSDPFNRTCYPWGQEDERLIAWYTALGELRASCPVLREGRMYRVPAGEGVVAFTREGEGDALLCAVNRNEHPATVTLPTTLKGNVLLGDGTVEETVLTLPPLSAAIVK